MVGVVRCEISLKICVRLQVLLLQVQAAAHYGLICQNLSKKYYGSFSSVQQKPGFSIGNQNQGPMLVSVMEKKLSFPFRNQNFL